MHKSFHVTLRSRDDPEPPSLSPGALIAYTDGASYGYEETRATGSSVVGMRLHNVVYEAAYHLKQPHSLQAEMFAIKKAAQWLLTQSADEFVIYSDCQLALRGLLAPQICRQNCGLQLILRHTFVDHGHLLSGSKANPLCA